MPIEQSGSEGGWYGLFTMVVCLVTKVITFDGVAQAFVYGISGAVGGWIALSILKYLVKKIKKYYVRIKQKEQEQD